MAVVLGSGLPTCNLPAGVATTAHPVANIATTAIPVSNLATTVIPVAVGGQTLAGLPLCDANCAGGYALAGGYAYAGGAPVAYAADGQVAGAVPAAQLAAPLSTAHFNYNAVAKARTVAAAAKAAYVNAAAAADAANRASALAEARYKAAKEDAENKAAKLQRDLDEAHIAHSRIARQTTYPCLG